jgi:hypothetical protein
MGPSMTQHQVTRVWTVEIRLVTGDPVVTCSQCGPVPVAPRTVALRTVILTHLARHARNEALTPYLRTCRCGEHGCRWHPRHRGCSGPLVLLLTRVAHGRAWRLADACRACATATEHAAEVPECGDAQLSSTHPTTADITASRSNAHADHKPDKADDPYGPIYDVEPTEQDLWFIDALTHD